MTRLRVFLLTASLVFAGVIGLAPQAQAADGNILPPFDLNQTWTICRGYNFASHVGTSSYGLDLTGAGCDENSATGRTVRAPISGTVAYPYQPSYGNLCINIAGGRSYTLTHINSSITSGTVSAGQAVGTVGAPGTRGNNGVAHIHFEIWDSSNCYSSSGIPFDSAYGTRICGAPNLTSSGPNYYNNGTWSGTSFTGQSCGEPPSPEPINWYGVVDATFDGDDRVVQGQTLASNRYIMSKDGRFVLHMQAGGNLVLANSSRGVMWMSGTGGNAGSRLVLQHDGNAVIYRPNGTAIWSTGQKGIVSLILQSDGNAVGVNSSGGVPWATGTGGSPSGFNPKETGDTLPDSWSLVQGQYLRSADGRYTAVMQFDGNFVVYAPGYRVIWNSGTPNNAGSHLVVQHDGNVVIYRPDGVHTWSTGKVSISSLTLQSDGNLVGHAVNGDPVWATNSSGKL